MHASCSTKLANHTHKLRYQLFVLSVGVFFILLLFLGWHAFIYMPDEVWHGMDALSEAPSQPKQDNMIQ